MPKFKTPAMEQAYNLRLDGAKGSQFNGQVRYATEETASYACRVLQATTDLECTAVDYYVAIEEPFVGAGRLRVNELLDAVAESHPISAEFDAEDESGDEMKLTLVDGVYTVSARNQEFSEVV